MAESDGTVKRWVPPFVAASILLAIFAGPPFLAYMAGVTFGQRCHKAYPNADYVSWEECVKRLSNGGQLRAPTLSHKD